MIVPHTAQHSPEQHQENLSQGGKFFAQIENLFPIAVCISTDAFEGLLHAENDEILIAGLKMIIINIYCTIIAMFTTKSGFGYCEFKSSYPNVEIWNLNSEILGYETVTPIVFRLGCAYKHLLFSLQRAWNSGLNNERKPKKVKHL